MQEWGSWEVEIVPSSQKESSVFIITEVHAHSRNPEMCNYFETIKCSLKVSE